MLCGGPLSGWQGDQPLIRDRFAALDRQPVGTRCQSGLGALEGRELIAQIIRETLVELGLGQICRLIRCRLIARHGRESGKRCFDPLTLLLEQLVCTFWIHASRLPAAALLD